MGASTRGRRGSLVRDLSVHECVHDQRKIPCIPLETNNPERRGWDSNPRYGYPYNGFRDRPIRPLWHLSGRLDHAPMAVGSGTFIVLVPWRQLKGSPNRPQARD